MARSLRGIQAQAFDGLIDCLRVSLGVNSPRLLEALEAWSERHWTVFLTLCVRHRVIAPVRRSLREWDRAPEWVVARLSDIETSQRVRQLRLVAALLEIAEVLREESIPFLCLKGPTLSQLLYDNPTERFSGDLDLLVSRGNLLQSVSILTERGYKLLEIERISAVDESSPFWRNVYHLHLEKDGVSLELHWRTSRNDALLSTCFDSLYSRRFCMKLNGIDLPFLGASDLYAHLVLHGTTHCWSRLKWLYDLELLRVKLPNAERDEPSLLRCTRLARKLGESFFGKELNGYSTRDAGSMLFGLVIAIIEEPTGRPDRWQVVLKRCAALFIVSRGMKAKLAMVRSYLIWPELYYKLKLPAALNWLYLMAGPFAWLFSKLAKGNRG